jgi:hypothetical protein
MMGNPTVVLIHSQGNSEGPLREAIEFYKPKMVFLISNHDASGALLVYKHLNEKDVNKLGRFVKDIEYSELLFIEDAFSSDTVLQMFTKIENAKNKAKEMSDSQELKFYAGVSGGTKMMVIGSALAAINDDISTYYVNKETLESSDNLLLELDFLNDLMSTISWLRGHYKNKNNLSYLKEVIIRDKEGLMTTAEEIAESMKPKTTKSVRNSMRMLKTRSLITYDESKKPHVYKPTLLGEYVVKMFYNDSND